MSNQAILTTIHDNGLAEVTLNRPEKHNAFDDAIIRELTDTLDSLQNDSRLRILALKGAGKSFSAGADLNWMKSMADYSWEENYQDSLGLATLMQTLHNFTRPTVAVVQGATYGGGLGLVSACDFAIASNKAKFCLSEVKLGLIPAVISPYVVKAIGERNAYRYFYSADVFDAERAMSMGLVQDVFEHEKFDQQVTELLERILSNGPEAVYQSKRLIERVANQPIEEELIRDTASKIADIRASVEGKEGVSAFLDKRPVDWKSVNNQFSTLLEDDE